MLNGGADDLVASADVSLGLGQRQFWQVFEAHLLQHRQRVRVHFDGVSVVDYGDLCATICGKKRNIDQNEAHQVTSEAELRSASKGTHLRSVVVSLLSLFFLQLDRDSLDRTSLDAPHETSDVTGDLVSHTLRRNFGDVITDAFVGVEIQRQARIVSLDDSSRRFLDGLGTNLTLFAEEEKTKSGLDMI